MKRSTKPADATDLIFGQMVSHYSETMAVMTGALNEFVRQLGDDISALGAWENEGGAPAESEGAA